MLIEGMPTDRAYDLVAAIVQHTLYDHEAVKRQTVTSYDAAHPPRVDRRVIRGFLEANFEPRYTDVVSARFTLVSAEVNAGFPYFIGPC